METTTTLILVGCALLLLAGVAVCICKGCQRKRKLLYVPPKSAQELEEMFRAEKPKEYRRLEPQKSDVTVLENTPIVAS